MSTTSPALAEAPKTVDWGSVRVLALAVGLREAARRLDISEDMVRKRSSREQWFAQPEVKQALAQATKDRAYVTNQSPKGQITAMQAMAQEMVALNAKTRLGFAKGLARGAEAVQELDGHEIIEKADKIKSLTGASSTVFGWEANQKPVVLRLEVTGGEVAISPDLSGEAIEAEQVKPGEWEAI